MGNSKALAKVREVFSSFDLFSALPTLRAKSESETTNTCGGVLSFLAIVSFMYIFIAQFK